MKAWIVTAVLLALVASATACGGQAEKESGGEPGNTTAEETTELAESTTEATTTEAAAPDTAPPDIQRRAEQAKAANPEKDWSQGYTPMPDGSIAPTAEVEDKMQDAVNDAMAKTKEKLEKIDQK